MSELRILYVGPDYAGSNGTCWRDAFQELGHSVRTIDDEPSRFPQSSLKQHLRRRLLRRPARDQIRALNLRLLREVREFRPDLTFFIKAYYVLPDTLEETGKYAPNFAYMNDDMFWPGTSTFTFLDNIKRMDCILTTKSFSVREYHAAGAPLAIYIPNAYDPRIHYPAKPSPKERLRYEGDVSFIGFFNPTKADLLSKLARYDDEFRFNVWGGSWDRMLRIDQWHRCWKWLRLRRSIRGRELWCADMGKAIQSNKINLGLLCRAVRDLHTSRSFEIPACGGFMLAERTEEHRMYFEEDREAVYFSTFPELLDKIRFYLGHDDLRMRIAEAGYQRCMRSGARYIDRARFALEQFYRIRRTHQGVTQTASDMSMASSVLPSRNL
jgi:spore maturation protein CgeB